MLKGLLNINLLSLYQTFVLLYCVLLLFHMRLGDWQDTSDLRPANMAEINIIRLMFDISLYHGMDNKGKKNLFKLDQAGNIKVKNASQ